jgi:GWxTD domain-containing protein
MPFAFALTFAILLPRYAPVAAPVASSLLSSTSTATSSSPPFNSGISEAVQWAVPFWFAGVAVFYLRSFLGWIEVRRLRRASTCQPTAEWRMQFERLIVRLRIPRTVTLLESALTEVPVVIGFLRPVVLMPVGLMTGLPASQVEAILIHELAHVRRWDYLVNLAQSAIEGLLFYHPAVWWISAIIRAERENCCDDVVVELACDRHSYAAALAAMEELRCGAPQPALAASGGNLMKRIRRILRQPDGPRSAISPALFSGILLVLAATLLAAWPPAPQTAVPTSRKLAPDARTKWLDEDAAYIITDAERAEFRLLKSDADFDRFIERFWQHRDKTEHYRRLAYANEHYASSVPGWKTQRGETYIKHGPPSAIERRGDLEVWTYKDTPGVVRSQLGGCGSHVPFVQDCQSAMYVFADRSHTGDYQLTTVDHRTEASLHGVLYTWHMHMYRFVHNLFHW